MNKTIILAATIIAFGIIVGAYVIGSFDRYAMIPTAEGLCVYRLDKWTGKSWQILGGVSAKEFIIEQTNTTRR